MEPKLRGTALTLLTALLLMVALGLAACTTTTSTSASSSTTSAVPTTTTAVSTTSTFEPATSTEYRNAQYGFSFSLPLSWEGYSIVTEQWEGFFPNNTNEPNQGDAPGYGPEILIRHPEWTASNPRQDIPIMVFTPAEWDLVQQGKLTIGAAPIPPSELGRNTTYVFALPARYNYAFPTGYEDVEKILAGNPLKGTAVETSTTQPALSTTYEMTEAGLR